MKLPKVKLNRLLISIEPKEGNKKTSLLDIRIKYYLGIMEENNRWKKKYQKVIHINMID